MENSKFLMVMAVVAVITSIFYDGYKGGLIALAAIVLSTGGVVCSSIEKKDK